MEDTDKTRDQHNSELGDFHQQSAELELFKRIVETTNNPVGLVDQNYVYKYVNSSYCDAFKRKKNEIIDCTVADLLGQEIFDNVLKPQYERCFGGKEVAFQNWFETPGWGRRYLDVRYYPFFGSGRNVSSVVVSAHDLTEIKQIEMKLEESEERFRTFMDNLPASAYIKTENDRHVYGNPAAMKSVKKETGEYYGLTTRDLWPSKIADKLIELDRKVIQEELPRITEEWQNTASGDISWRRDIKFPIRLGSGEKLLGGIAIDITEIKRSEQNLRDAYNEIKQLKEKLAQENIYLREEIEVRQKHEDIIGNSEAVKTMLSRAEQVAATDSTVLILGETGTGKELLAHTIHKHSDRKDRPMIKVNCAALPATLIESELFGRERGAYTGAMNRQIGRFEIADGSTIFLDEIGELPMDLQAKLLRVLEEGQFERLGSPQTISVNVRIISSTNRDIARAVAKGRFREDLYYRLNVFPLSVPMLRDRIEDIPMLVWAFVKEFGKSMGKTIENIPQSTMTALQRYPWPGNVRELRNITEQAMIISQGTTLMMQLPESSGYSGAVSLKDVERNHIVRTLRQTGWRIRGKKGAAELLGLKPTTLEARIKKLEITRPD